MDPNGSKLIQMDPNGSKWIPMDATGSGMISENFYHEPFLHSSSQKFEKFMTGWRIGSLYYPGLLTHMYWKFASTPFLPFNVWDCPSRRGENLFYLNLNQIIIFSPNRPTGLIRSSSRDVRPSVRLYLSCTLPMWFFCVRGLVRSVTRPWTGIYTYI